jgi:hypothetical protein
MSKKRNLVNDKTYHYTYRITNIKDRIYYYGVHSCDCLPKEDIGVRYFSTSTIKEFIKDQKENPQNYKYKVVKLFSSRKEAEEHEQILHKKFNVRTNKKFYNKHNANEKWSTYGIPAWNKGLTKNDHPSLMKFSQTIAGENHPMFGKQHTNEAKDKMKKAHANKTLTQEHKDNIGKSVTGELNGMYGKKHNDEAKLIFSKTHKGKIPWNKGLIMPEDYSGKIRVLKVVICPHCNLIGKGGNMTRYHFDNCKQKENIHG